MSAVPPPDPGAPPAPAPAPKSTNRNLISRVGVAIVAIPLLLLVMYLDEPAWTWSLVFAASLLAMYEFFGMAIDDRTDRFASLAIGAATVAALYWVPSYRAPGMLAMFLAVVPTGLYYVFRFGAVDTAVQRMTASVTGIMYGGVLFTFVALLKRDGGSGDWVLLILLVPWISDTFAYFAGRALGKRKMYPALSPGKTWAGAAGGLAGACAATAFVKVFRLEEMGWVDVAVLGLAGGTLCQLGDLFESLVKRSCGVKDSGTLLRGHGGMLDRLDAVIVFAPFVYLYFRVLG